MYNILIVENNLKIIENIINNISYSLNIVKVCNIASDMATAKSTILSQKADIIILGISFHNFKNFIDNKGIQKYKQSIIMIPSNNIDNFYTPLIVSMQKIINSKENTKLVKSQIRAELSYLNYNYSYIGTRYLEDLIFEFYKIKDCFDGNFKSTLYPILSNKHNKTIDTIYGNIKQATNLMILDCEESKLLRYFSYDSFYKPKIKEIVYTIINKIT